MARLRTHNRRAKRKPYVYSRTRIYLRRYWRMTDEMRTRLAEGAFRQLVANVTLAEPRAVEWIRPSRVYVDPRVT